MHMNASLFVICFCLNATACMHECDAKKPQSTPFSSFSRSITNHCCPVLGFFCGRGIVGGMSSSYHRHASVKGKLNRRNWLTVKDDLINTRRVHATVGVLHSDLMNAHCSHAQTNIS